MVENIITITPPDTMNVCGFCGCGISGRDFTVCCVSRSTSLATQSM